MIVPTLSDEMIMIKVNGESSADFPSPFRREAGSTAIYVSKYLSTYPEAEIYII